MDKWNNYRILFYAQFRIRISQTEKLELENRLKQFVARRKPIAKDLLIECEATAFAMMADKPQDSENNHERIQLTFQLFEEHCDPLCRSIFAKVNYDDQGTMEQLATAIAQATSTRNKARKYSKYSQQNNSSIMIINENDELEYVSREELPSVAQQRDSSVNAIQNTGTGPRANRDGKTACHYCNQEGHFKRSCPTFEKNEPNGYKQYNAAIQARRPPSNRGNRGSHRGNRGGGRGRANQRPYGTPPQVNNINEQASEPTEATDPPTTASVNTVSRPYEDFDHVLCRTSGGQ